MTATGTRLRKIDTRIWDDQRYRSLSPLKPSGQALWLYILTGPHNGLVPGLSRASRPAFMDDLGWDHADFSACWQEIEKTGLAQADWDARVLWVPKMIWYNRPASPKDVLLWAEDWSRIPDCELKAQAWATLRSDLAVLGHEFATAFESSCKIQKEWLMALAPDVRQTLPNEEPQPLADQLLFPELENPQGGSDIQSSSVDYAAVKNLYNEILGDVLSKVSVRGKAVDRYISGRWRDIEQSLPKSNRNRDAVLSVFRHLFQQIRQSEFLCGNNRHGWKADLVWIMRPTNFERIVNGAFNRAPTPFGFQRSREFKAFIASYPIQTRIAEAHRIWVDLGVDGNELLYEKIMSFLHARKSSKEWLRGGGRYIPSPDRFLADRLWEIEEVEVADDILSEDL